MADEKLQKRSTQFKENDLFNTNRTTLGQKFN